jgi:hypothetical protein
VIRRSQQAHIVETDRPGPAVVFVDVDEKKFLLTVLREGGKGVTLFFLVLPPGTRRSRRPVL